MSDAIKTTFIERAVAEYHRRTIRDIKGAARRLKVGVTDEGVNSLAYEIAVQGGSVSSKLSFREYLRMVDMGAGRGHKLGKLTKVSVALQGSNRVGDVITKDKGRKPKKLYSKTAYGNLGSLYGKLLYGYTEETKAAIKAELENQKQII